MNCRISSTCTVMSLVVLLVAGSTGQATAAVTVSQKGSILYVTGTAANEQVFIIGVDGHAGKLTVKPTGQPMTAHTGVQHLQVNLGGGNNGLAILQVNLAGNVTVTGGSGNNSHTIGYEPYLPNLIGGHLQVTCSGASQTLLEQSWVFGNATFNLGEQDTLLTIGRPDTSEDLGAVVLGDLTVESGAGDDLIEVSKSWIQGDAVFITADGDDDVILGTEYESGSAIAGSVFVGNLAIETGAGEDSVGLTDNNFDGDVAIELGNDDDELILAFEPEMPVNQFAGEFDAHGGNGEDTLHLGLGNDYANEPSFHSFEVEIPPY